MTAALTVYSATFMRYSLAVTPKNYLLFLCHFVNFNAQLTQGYRYLKYWKYVFSGRFPSIWSLEDSRFLSDRTNAFGFHSGGGREAALAQKAAQKGMEAADVAENP